MGHRWSDRAVVLATIGIGSVLGAECSGGSAGSDAVPSPEVSVVVDGLDRPTQMSSGPDGLLVVAQLAGGENDATGEIVAVDVAAGTRRVIADGLDKPTGVLWDDGVLWVMVRQGLVRFEWADSSGPAGEPETVLDDLPFNGRSEGTLTALDDGRFLYATTGTLTGDAPATGSATLWVFDPTDDSSQALATGLKNAYAHTVLDDSIAITEIGDSSDDPPVEEVDVIEFDDIDTSTTPPDFGWPTCPGNDDCQGVARPLAVFPVASTPTGVATSGDDVFVALFVSGQLMRIETAGWEQGDAPVDAVEVIAGLDGPHTVLAQPDGTLWISEHLADRIISVRP
jgi:glucose/arabinose dehydrogenase